MPSLARVALIVCSLLWADQLGASPGDDAAVRVAGDALKQLPRAYGRDVMLRTFAEDGRGRIASSTAITLVVGDSRTSTVHMDVTSNCRADAADRQVRCDLSLLDDLLREFRLDDGAKAELFAIILAHELGHVVLNHRRSAYHGRHDAISVLDYASHRTELEADAFAVALLDGMPEPILGPYRLIEHLARTAQHRSLCPEIFPAPCPCPPPDTWVGCSTLPVGPGLPSLWRDTVKVTLRGTHPEFVVRFIRMLHLSTDPRVRTVYQKDARFELQKMVVRDERGTVQGFEHMFQESQVQRRVRDRVTRLVRRRIRQGPR